MSDLAPRPGEDGEDLVAAEYVLGVLDADARRAAERRIASDVAFAHEVDQWGARLAPLAMAIAGQAPPEALWRSIERRLDPPAAAAALSASSAQAGSNVVDLDQRRLVFLWRSWAAVASAAAAVLLVIVAWPRAAPRPILVAQAVPPAAPAPLMTARLATTAGAADFVVAFQPEGRVVTITPASVSAVKGRAPELWLLPTGGKPVPLGVVSFERPIRLAAAPDMGGAGRLALAVSIEPPGGSPTGQPTGPVVATGALQET